MNLGSEPLWVLDPLVHSPLLQLLPTISKSHVASISYNDYPTATDW